MVGRALSLELARRGHIVRVALRAVGPAPSGATEVSVIGDMTGAVEWDECLRDVDAVVHLAAKVHQPVGKASAALYTQTNALASGRLAEAAGRRGVRRFVFLSTVKVNGEESGCRSFTPDDEPAPGDDYARSKLRGEQLVREIAQTVQMEVAIVRPPLVYGPGVRANFLRLMQWVASGRPVPVGGIRNRRSLVNVWNLTSLVALLVETQSPIDRVWMVSDGEDLSTPDLIRAIGHAMKREPRLVRVPERILRLFGHVIGRAAEMDRLCGSLSVDISATKRDLNWEPTVGVDEGLRRTVKWFISGGRLSERVRT